MVRILLIAVAAVFLVILLKPLKGEYAMLTVLAGGILILRYGVEQMQQILETVETLKGYMPYVSNYLGLFVKMIGITIYVNLRQGFAEMEGVSH